MDALIDVTNIIIETKRLILRPWQLSDLDDFYEYSKVDGVGQMAGWLPHQSKEESLNILNSFIANKKTLAVVLKENNKVIGSIGIESITNEEMIASNLKGREIGYVLSKDYWGKGLMTEACCSVIDYCFKILKYDFLLCGYFNHNTQSKRVNEKCGFKFLKYEQYKTSYGSIEESTLNILYNDQISK